MGSTKTISFEKEEIQWKYTRVKIDVDSKEEAEKFAQEVFEQHSIQHNLKIISAIRSIVVPDKYYQFDIKMVDKDLFEEKWGEE